MTKKGIQINKLGNSDIRHWFKGYKISQDKRQSNILSGQEVFCTHMEDACEF